MEDISSKYLDQLPEDILISIICKLSTEDGARTVSLVSRRWNHLWKSLLQSASRLSFHIDNIFPNSRYRLDQSKVGRRKKQLVEAANRVLLELHRASTLEELTIGWNLNFRYSSEITSWLEFAARKRVKKLKLEFDSEFCDKTTWPFRLRPIVVGRLSMYWLRDLHIRRVDADQKAIEAVISNSSFLERLTLIDIVNLTELEIVSAPALNYLNIGSCCDLQWLSITAPNLNTMQISNLCEIIGIRVSSVPRLSDLIISIPHMLGFVLNCYGLLLNQLNRLELCISSWVSAFLFMFLIFPSVFWFLIGPVSVLCRVKFSLSQSNLLVVFYWYLLGHYTFFF